MNWNVEQELYLKNLGEQAMAYTWMQEQTSMFYIKVDRWLGIMIIILSGIVGTNNFFGSEISTREVIFGVLGYFVSILGMINQFIKPMENSQQRLNIGNKFQEIYFDIKQQLVKAPEERKNPDDYLENMTQKFIEVYDFAPPISNFIIRNFKTIFKNSNITMPLNADFIDQIRIFQSVTVNDKCDHQIQLTQTQSNDKFEQFVMERLNRN